MESLSYCLAFSVVCDATLLTCCAAVVKPGGLSEEAKIGLGVGLAVGLLLLIVILVICCCCCESATQWLLVLYAAHTHTHVTSFLYLLYSRLVDVLHRKRSFPQNCPFRRGDLDLHLTHDSLGRSEPTTQTPSRSVQPSSYR